MTRPRALAPRLPLPRSAAPLRDSAAVTGHPGGVLVAVTGASGGIGASVVTAALAVRAVAAGLTACAVDLDPLGGGLDVVLGLEQTDGTRWGDLAGLEGEADGVAVLATLPRVDGVRVLSHDRHGGGPEPSVVRALVSALVRACDLVVLDLPRWGRLPDGAPPLDRRFVVAGTTLAQVAGLSAWMATSGEVGSCGVLVREGVPSGAATDDVVSVVIRQIGAQVVGVVPDDRSVPADLAHGVAPGGRAGPLVRALDPLLAELVHGRPPGAV